MKILPGVEQHRTFFGTNFLCRTPKLRAETVFSVHCSKFKVQTSKFTCIPDLIFRKLDPSKANPSILQY
jgi:hypothetical protein